MAIERELPPQHSPAFRIGPQSAGARVMNAPIGSDVMRASPTSMAMHNALKTSQAGSTLKPEDYEIANATVTAGLKAGDNPKAILDRVNPDLRAFAEAAIAQQADPQKFSIAGGTQPQPPAENNTLASVLGAFIKPVGMRFDDMGSTTAALANGAGTNAGQTPDAAALIAQQRKAAQGSIAV